MDEGKVQVYTGNGKGKTTAAVGLAVRAAGAGLRVYFGQFMKNNETGELAALRALGNRVVVEQYGTGGEIAAPDPQADARATQAGLKRAREALLGGRYDVVVLDEANVADALGYLDAGALLELVRERPRDVELVLTGRGAGGDIRAAADLVTEMREVKHYFRDGVPARRGIEF
ncbi:cob(I)yrinic acid a,c-diamide adenosyltransferase [Gordonibacter massiliensis (ex Traore et al. 2017)]|uniref:Cob(I)yrinic acid a,c-diamide adenosyltransferase n=1 Tax=Gordonibacter massiliensis (ex Traore et al. 2017) TaxID=1841863 RepID=A0A842JGQ8_9ACTN|nr:cob(I)yrinic acid a,c-diamide adenosyltransferase [Gordonibacter massiliensis (ex Traore et al. 2017)]MBC2888995.1 cob(I)yrinic acid a,c-diamide adenosyltransferase [Gordonibacter massiliensis (ex Traore et al. 2017)]